MGVTRVAEILAGLPKNDSDPGALPALLEANRELRHLEWPAPYRQTSHRLRIGDARDLSFIADESVHLVVTSPPYWTLKQYNDHPEQMGSINDYDHFLDELDKVWAHCLRVLVPGGRVCCNVGDVCIARKQAGRHFVMPLHADIQVRARRLGFDLLTPVLWAKISNGVTEAAGNGAGFYGKPYQPGAIIKNDVEYVLFFRKGGKYRSVPTIAKALSMLSKTEMQAWFRSVWTDIPGTSSPRHPAPYPLELASRLIRMFSFAGDTVLDPFLGTGTTMVAAMQSGRSSIGTELDAEYAKTAITRCRREVMQPRGVGATDISLFIEASTVADGSEAS
ncbi:MAG TPA: site-specific DNA-methyltransferase [Tepidisphaeraceae bacterium]|nr:site-specific DNA-methyltransferase [Tepidisphaeraceae bacterium]